MFANLLTGATIAWSAGNALAAGVARGGVNIAGFDFGCDTSVWVTDPLRCGRETNETM